MGRLLVIAGTSGPFADFGTFAPAIKERGAVAFQATRRNGATGVFCGDGGPITCLHQTAAYRSHPDINDAGELCAYADLPDGREALLVGKPGQRPDAIAPDTLPAIGPLGPTMNETGAVAFRGTTAQSGPGIYVADGDRLTTVAAAGAGRFSGFEGLPVILADGRVVFRADRGPHRHSIHLWAPDGRERIVAETGDRFSELGRFPHANARGDVVFDARPQQGRAGIFRAREGEITPVVDTTAGFEEFRGALVDDAGRVVFYATPTGGTLAIHRSENGVHARVVGLGDELAGSPIIDLALNPVSFNNTGQIALRLKLADGRQFIARLDVFES